MQSSNFTRWAILALCALTIILAFTMPTLMLPVLFAEMAEELDLTILQLGVAWGSISLSGIVISLFGGALGDRFGSKKTLAVACLLMGILGALRGLSSNYITLIATFMLYSLVAPAIPPNLHKAGAYLFPESKGISTGVISTGFAFSLFLGSRFLATWVSPTLGGWRNTLFMFGAIGIVFGLIWLFAVPDGVLPQPAGRDKPFFSGIFSGINRVIRVRELMIISAGSLLFWGCYRGFTGYVPIYLRNLGWDAVKADSALSNYFLASLIFALPIVYLAEKWGQRKPLLILAMLLNGVGVILIGTGNEFWIIVGLIAGGIMFDAYMALHQAEVLDLTGIGPFVGSALGILGVSREIGGLFSPPFGNWLSQFGDTAPFFFWGGLGLVAALVYMILPKRKPVID